MPRSRSACARASRINTSDSSDRQLGIPGYVGVERKWISGNPARFILKGSKMIKLLSHLSYVSITSPDVEASVDFYVNQVGLTVVDRIDGAVYLRCWGDYYAYSVVVLPGDEPSLDTAAWRTSSPEALEEAAKRI